MTGKALRSKMAFTLSVSLSKVSSTFVYRMSRSPQSAMVVPARYRLPDSMSQYPLAVAPRSPKANRVEYSRMARVPFLSRAGSRCLHPKARRKRPHPAWCCSNRYKSEIYKNLRYLCMAGWRCRIPSSFDLSGCPLLEIFAAFLWKQFTGSSGFGIIKPNNLPIAGSCNYFDESSTISFFYMSIKKQNGSVYFLWNYPIIIWIDIR